VTLSQCLSSQSHSSGTGSHSVAAMTDYDMDDEPTCAWM